MAIQENSPAIPQDASEITSQAMTFNKLHADFKLLGLEDCDCTKLAGALEDYESSFTRLMRAENDGKSASDADFASHYEMNIEPTKEPPTTCEQHCEWRGVSVNKLNTSNLEKIQKRYRSLSKNCKWLGSYYCIFRLKQNTGKVWTTNPRDTIQHFNLLKCDNFGSSSIIISRIDRVN